MNPTVLFHPWLVLVPIRKGSVVLKQQRDYEGNMLSYLLPELDNLTPASEGLDGPSPTSKVGDLLGILSQVIEWR